MRPDASGGGRSLAALQSIQVYLWDDAADENVLIGNAEDALHDPRLTAGERKAVRNMAGALDYVEDRFGYTALADATNGVKMMMRLDKGPSVSTGGRISIPAENPFTLLPESHPAPDVLLPAAVARHELVHVMQTQMSGHVLGPPPEQPGRGADYTTPYEAQSVGEGLADAFALLQSRTWKTGGAYFKGKDRVARDYGNVTSHNALQEPRTTYDHGAVRDLSVDPHVQGGVVVMVAKSLVDQLGRDAAQDVMWEVFTDETFIQGRQAWPDLNEAFQRVSESSPTDVSRAIRTALHETKLEQASSI